MSEFQLSHIALVGARIEAFSEYGVTSRNELTLRRIVPSNAADCLQGSDPSQTRKELAGQLPIWIHNAITDPDFPSRKKLLMPLRRFEGELKDKKDNEVISAVMSAGFKSETLDPLNLPRTMSMRQRVAIVAQIDIWQDAYSKLESEFVDLILDEATAIAKWCELASQPGNSTIEQQ
ncbi:MAG: hypothetical protein V7709_07525 [Halioglobus sp.]